MPTLDDLRAQADAHQRDLDARKSFYTAQELAARWNCNAATVRNIPPDRLPWTPAGTGGARVHRRYAPADVARYERTYGGRRTDAA